MSSLRSRLSTLWLFATVNYLYCDVVTLMNPDLLRRFMAGEVDGMQITPGFLFGAAILVEIPMAMILLSRVLGRRANRWANVTAGATMTAVQLLSLFAQAPPPIYYMFFSMIEIATTSVIAWQAFKSTGAARELSSPAGAVCEAGVAL
jgi:hypothetical protein